jgi:hypothetical protein
MESDESLALKNDDDEGVTTVKPTAKIDKTSTAIPFLITIIGIFCYLGVVLPSVFNSSNEFFDYSIFDILLMVGGAALVGMGVYFWHRLRIKVLQEESALELV